MPIDPTRPYTTGEVAKICRFSQQTVIRLIDTERLKGYSIPGSKFRRVLGSNLLKFLSDNNMGELADLDPTPGPARSKPQSLESDPIHPREIAAAS